MSHLVREGGGVERGGGGEGEKEGGDKGRDKEVYSRDGKKLLQTNY